MRARASTWHGVRVTADDAPVVVCGPVSWNHLIVLDRLPEPVPHMQLALDDIHTVGGTSAGKALHLTGAGRAVVLHTQLAEDDDGRAVRAALTRAGVDLRAHPSERTERHVNLMTRAGERVSLYVTTPSEPDEAALVAAERSLDAAAAAVLDLGAFGARLIARRRTAGWQAPVWVDLHDYDGGSPYHEPFLRAADVVFMNDDRAPATCGSRLDDAWALLAGCVARGPRLAVCTRGADGAIALTADGQRAEIAAAPAEVVDTNGAGDAFLAGFLAAHLGGDALTACLASGARAAATAIGSRHMHPRLDGIPG